jgi:hypothetical protein
LSLRKPIIALAENHIEQGGSANAGTRSNSSAGCGKSVHGIRSLFDRMNDEEVDSIRAELVEP